MKKVLLWIGAVLIAVPVVLFVRFAVNDKINTRIQHADVMRRLYAADPKELLAACRVVMTNYPAYRSDPNWGGGGPHPDPTDPKMPEAIRKLQPDGVIIHVADPNRDDLAESYRYGFVQVIFARDAFIAAFPEGKDPKEEKHFGKKIIEGLYYFECNGGG